MIRALSILLGLFALCCNSARDTGVRPDFRVELYSYGGIAGGASGVTVTGDGWARRWAGRTAALRGVRDSVQIESELLTRIDSLSAAADVAAPGSEQTGNITTVLTVQRGEKVSRVSFSGEQVPDSLPPSARELIAVLRNLQTR